MPITCSCPSCGSENTQRVSLAYQAGVSSGLSLTVGGIKGGRHNALGGGITIGETSSNLSKSLCPPQKKDIGFPATTGVCFFVMAVFMAYVMVDQADSSETSDQIMVFLLILIAIVLWCIRVVVMRIRFNKDLFPTQSKNWNAEFICLRCSRRFRVD